eukprot:TRINITY_DN4334_c0_g1_i13.p1 TRINITY_DN4334_c0_g1~~TRINITY_DN4334_c0_g1_i13.p1  ORF type:complete len:239 (+),score=32.43 TRINITY_DN4334_c0_g1_i13:125-841(+)
MKTRHQLKLAASSPPSPSPWALDLAFPQHAVLHDLKLLASLPADRAASPAQSKSTQLSAAPSPELVLERKAKGPLGSGRKQRKKSEEGKGVATESDSKVVERLYQFCKDVWNKYKAEATNQQVVEEDKNKVQELPEYHKAELSERHEVPMQEDNGREMHPAQYKSYPDIMAGLVYDFYSKYFGLPKKNSQLHVLTAYRVYGAQLANYAAPVQECSSMENMYYRPVSYTHLTLPTICSV